MRNVVFALTNGAPYMPNAKREAGIVAKRIRFHRDRNGMTQQDLATKAKVSRSYITRIEGSPEPPPHDVLVNIATALAVTPGELLEEFSDEHARVEATRNALEAARITERAVQELQRFISPDGSASTSITIERNVPAPEGETPRGVNQLIVVPTSWITGISLQDVFAARVVSDAFEHHHILKGDVVIVHRNALPTTQEDIAAATMSGEFTLVPMSELSGLRFSDVRLAGRVLGVLRTPRGVR